MPPPSSRMTKNQLQTTRYFPGKAVVDDVNDEDEESEEEEEDEDEQPAAPRAVAPKATSFPAGKKLAVDLSRAGQQKSAEVTIKEPEDDLDGFVTASESSEEGEEGSSDEEEESSEDESSDDEPKKPMLRPTFISKAKRAQQATTTPAQSEAQRAEEEERKRKEKADELLQGQLERDAAAKAAGRKAWDDDADIDPEHEVDDTDGLDPEAEKAAWKLRELKRVRRERLAIEEKEKELAEIERRRNMTAAEREAEDKAYIEAQKEEREGKGKMAYMQKYHHKGAFFAGDEEQDEEVKAIIGRDLAGARYEDEAGDKSVLPEYMRIRDMTKLGKKGRTKYKDLKHEDTGRWGMDVGRRRRDEDGLDERFRPDEPRDGGREQTGANAQPVGERRRREDEGRGDGKEKRARYD
ncbi:MFAP1 C-domain-containing protein [Teratosphaeria destructans]|uniref:MFAP1 C-domain-containing protein n=1 Tax=Teratosphaeria destructans TaxID=418781 RepID=A0A9W7W1P0_9PEZI|nr:MFAP1 C-domain-containing protein [Teratosphaeria destructans]